MHEPFSLLLSVYDGDRPDYIRRALRSAVDDQTVRPDQVVIVRDGPVRPELAECLDDLAGRPGTRVGVLGEELEDQAIEGRGHVGVEPPGRDRLLTADLVERLDD